MVNYVVIDQVGDKRLRFTVSKRTSKNVKRTI